MSRHPRPELPDSTLSVVWQSASLLLDYPDATLRRMLPVVRAACRQLPDPLGGPLHGLAVHLQETRPTDLQAGYVATFDARRRSNLYLTYFAHGDTRKRGLALLRFKQTYRRSGFVLDEGELPDHLSVVLEYAATVDRLLGWELLLDHRAGLELVRIALAEEGSPWLGALEAVCATLPRLRGDEQEAVRRLAVEGPPAEEVGLTPYGTPSFDPLLAGRGNTDLPMPTMRGAGT